MLIVIVGVFMNLVISFSGRENGNCDNIANYIGGEKDTVLTFRNLNVHDCSNCQYECFHEKCIYREDDIYTVFEKMPLFDKIFLVVPMYCGNPSSLYFKFNERCQDFFMHNEGSYFSFLSKLYIIGVYGDHQKSPDFIPLFEKWFVDTPFVNRVLGLERHKYNLKISDELLSIEEVKRIIDCFIEL